MKSKKAKLKSTDLYETKIKKQDFNDLSEIFLQTPPSFILRGPIYLVLFILIVAVIYSSVTTTNIKVTGYMTIKGEEYTLQSPVNGLVNIIYQLENNNIKINDKLISLYSQTAFSKEAGLSLSKQKKNDLIKKYQWLYSFRKKIDNLISVYAKKNTSFEIKRPKMPKNNRIDFINIKDSVDLKNIGDFGLKYLNLRQNIVLLWQDYKRLKKLKKQLGITYRENIDLLKKQFISRQEYLNSQQAYNRAKGEMEGIIKNFKVSIFTTYQEIYQGLETVAFDIETLDREIKSLKNLLSGIEIIGNSFLLRSKYGGVITDNFVKPNQMVSEGMPLMKIIRDDYPLVGKIQLPTFQINKIKVGQFVAIQLDAFPFQIYGVQKGKVIEISSDIKISDNGAYGYEITVALIPNKKIQYKPGMGGIAEIKVGEKRIIEIALAPVSKIIAYLRGEN